MKSYLLYKEKSVKVFKKLVSSSGNLFDKYRPMATSYIRYAGSDLDKNLVTYEEMIRSASGKDLSTINLEDIFPANYKWLIGEVSMRNSRDYILALESRLGEFQGKEDNLKLLVGVYFIKFVLVTKIVETYLASLSSFVERGVDASDVTLNKIGIGKSVLKYFDELEDLQSRTIDEWLNYKADPIECRYFYSSMKRILTILLGEDGSIK